MPSRETVNIVPQISRYLTTSFNGVALSSGFTQQTVNMNLQMFRRDWTNTPGYRSKVKHGARLPNNALREYRMSQQPVVAVGVGGIRSGVTWTTREGNRRYDLGGPTFPDGFASLNAELTLKALNRAKQSSFNAPIFFAEAGKTTDMILNRLADLRELARDLRRGNVSSFLTKSEVFYKRSQRRVKRVPGLPDYYPPDWRVKEVERKFNRQFGRDAQVAAGNLWLEWKYGWLSLMTDVKGLSEHIEEVRSKDVNLDGKIKTSVTRRTFTQGPYSLEQTPSCQGVREDTLMIKGTLTCRFKMDNPNLLLPAKVGLTNPLSVAWELVPFSFVVDWFLPIGKFIDALDVHFLYTFTDKIITNKAIFHRKVTVTQSDLFNYSVSGSGDKLVIVKNRDATSMALPFSSIQWKNGFANPERLFTSLALLGQTLSGFKHPTHGTSPSK